MSLALVEDIGGEKPLRILFATASWGLGHATRDLALIDALLNAGHELTVISSERAIQLLRSELGGRCKFIDVPDIPKPLSRRPIWFYVRMSLALPLVFWSYWREHQVVRRLHRQWRFDRVISDTRYGVFLSEIPSYHLIHSLRQIVPGRPRNLEAMVERVQNGLLAGARKVIVPDLPEGGLAGDLCHNLAYSWGDKLEYIGILSSIKHRPTANDVDYFISVSGAEPQRTIFEKMVLEQARELNGNVVIALGRPDLPFSVRDDGRIKIYSYIGRRQQEEMLNRAGLVVSRSGYTTLMELAELGKLALFVPTAGQSEQEYLGDYHEKQGTIHTVKQRNLNLSRDVSAAAGYKGISLEKKTKDSIKRFLELVES